MAHAIKSVGIICGSASSFEDAFAAAAGLTGAQLGHQKLSLVYGGERLGLSPSTSRMQGRPLPALVVGAGFKSNPISRIQRKLKKPA
ncbi:MAG: hypothetical protein ABJL99_08710 [Aliishimia sp.]